MTRWIPLALCLCACGAPVEEIDAATLDAATLDAGARPPGEVGPDDRRAALFAPPIHDGVTELPLVVVLHGHGVDGNVQDLYFRMTRNARVDGFYVLLPDGLIGSDGEPGWDTLGTTVDDHAYLRALIEEVLEVVPIDRSSVSLVGHSNGGFMAFRLACESADLVTGIVSFGGSDAIPACAPSTDVSVLHIHGTADTTIPYDGGTIRELVYPAATVVAETWAMRVGCDPASTTSGEALDLVTDVDGAETSVLTYDAGCRAGVALWTMEGVDHIPALTTDFTPAVLAWLRANTR